METSPAFKITKELNKQNSYHGNDVKMKKEQKSLILIQHYKCKNKLYGK